MNGMKVKNGIIIDEMLHELCDGMCDECDDSSEIICNINMDQRFVSRGKVTDIKTKEEKK
jgi:hypothetical protein